MPREIVSDIYWIYCLLWMEKRAIKEPTDSYLHTYYEDTEDLYRENIYRLAI